jgi:hypothetical protein
MPSLGSQKRTMQSMVDAGQKVFGDQAVVERLESQ